MSMKIRRLVSKLRVLMMMRCYYRLLISRFGFRVVNRCGRCMVFWFWMVSRCRRHRCVVFRLRMVFWFRVVCRCYRCMIFRFWMVSRCHHRCMIFGLRMVSRCYRCMIFGLWMVSRCHRCMIFGLRMVSRCHRCMVFGLWMISWSGRCMILWLRWSMVFRLRMISGATGVLYAPIPKSSSRVPPPCLGGGYPWKADFKAA